jgi:hypothetical protein
VSLPAALVAFVRRAAAREDRTVSGQVRHYIATAARLEPPPPRKVPQNVPPTPEGIAEAKTRLATQRQRRDGSISTTPKRPSSWRSDL